MNKFLIAYKHTCQNEGGYSNDVDDRGRETYKGISRRFWPKWEGWAIVDAYKNKRATVLELDSALLGNKGLQGLVEQFYHEKFWLPLRCDELKQEIANELFDTAVNQGKIMAGTYFQQALNKLNRNQKDYLDLLVDGRPGYNTISAYEAYMQTQHFSSRNYEKLTKWLLRWLNYYQLRRYDLITNNDKSQEKFIPGWTERG